MKFDLRHFSKLEVLRYSDELWCKLLSSELSMQIKEKETRIQALDKEIESGQKRLRECKEELAEKDGQLKALHANLANADKQRTRINEDVINIAHKLTNYVFVK